MPARFATGLELAVSAMLVVLGLVRLREALRGIVAAGPWRGPAPHQHDANETEWRVGIRALLVGAVHGMAGTAALTAAMAYPVVRLGRLRWMRDTMAIASGLAAIVFGCWYAARLV